jgi:hypothetical protein
MISSSSSPILPGPGSRFRSLSAARLSLAVALALPACAHERPQVQSEVCAPHIHDLGWMTGSWTCQSAVERLDEHWTDAGGRSMLGVGRRVTGDQTLFFEYLRIEERSDGIYYIAHPKAGPGVEFKLVACRRGEARFENPAHDYPRSIRYRRNSDGTIGVRLEGIEAGQALVEEFLYRRKR